MKKISMIAASLVGAAVLCAAPISLHQAPDKGLSLSVDKAQARYGINRGHHVARHVARRTVARRYYYHGAYWNYRYHGNYYNYRYRGHYYRYQRHHHYYNHRRLYHHHYRYW